jgi:hypothetical protein
LFSDFNSEDRSSNLVIVSMADSKYKIVKDGWGSRTNFQASHGLGMTNEELVEGDKILDAMQRVDTCNSEDNAEEGK